MQAFLVDRDEQQPIFELLIAESRHLSDKPEVASQVAELQRRWDEVYNRSEKRTQQLHAAQVAWTKFENVVGELERSQSQIAEVTTTVPNLYATEVPSLEKQLSTHKVTPHFLFFQIFGHVFEAAQISSYC